MEITAVSSASETMALIETSVMVFDGYVLLFCFSMPENIIWNRCLMTACSFSWNHQALIVTDLRAFVRLKIACYLRQQPVAHFILKLSFLFYCLPGFQLPSERNIQQARQSCVFSAVYWVSLWDVIFSLLSRYTERGNVHRGLDISPEKPVLHFKSAKMYLSDLFSLRPFPRLCLVVTVMDLIRSCCHYSNC